MTTVARHNLNYLQDFFGKQPPHGIILSGIVGCGKTFLISQLGNILKNSGFEILEYDGDDVNFRASIRGSGKVFIEEILSHGFQRPFICVDEIQKEPEIFDALKLVHDKLKTKFIVSGSNPAYLQTTANHRLQRRAFILPQLPFSISELALHEQYIASYSETLFRNLIWQKKDLDKVNIPHCPLHPGISNLVNRYLFVGGLPEAWLADSAEDSLNAIKLVAERGITETYQTTIAVDDDVRRYLADQNAKEFTYKGISQALRSSKRHIVDRVIDHLLNHGYLFKKRPYLGKYEFSHSTYFATYSWVDPGIISYYQGEPPNDQEQGFRLESYIHGQLLQHLTKIPVKGNVFYFKPFLVKKTSKILVFDKGELDFIVKIGREVTPIEVKKTTKINEIDTALIEEFIRTEKTSYGIIIYGGAPFIDKQKKLVYFPYWLI